MFLTVVYVPGWIEKNRQKASSIKSVSVFAERDHGQRTLLTPGDEDSLVEFHLYSTCHTFPLTKPQVLAHFLAFFNHQHPQAPQKLAKHSGSISGSTTATRWGFSWTRQKGRMLFPRGNKHADRPRGQGEASPSWPASTQLGKISLLPACILGEVHWAPMTGKRSPMLSTENRQQGKWTVSFSGSGLLGPLLVMNGQQSHVDPELTHRERGSNIPFQEAPCPLSPTPEPTSTWPSSQSFYTVLSLDHWTANWETVCWVERIFLYFIVGLNLRLHLLWLKKKHLLIWIEPSICPHFVVLKKCCSTWWCCGSMHVLSTLNVHKQCNHTQTNGESH